MLGPLAFIIATAVHPVASPPPSSATHSPLRVDVATSLAGPLASAAAHLAPGKPGGTTVSLHNVNTHETLTTFLRFDGVTDAESGRELARFFRCKRSGRQRPIDRGTLAIFARVVERYPGKVIEIVSGVRKPGFGVRDSKHYSGHAIDFRVRGVPTRKVRELLWSFDEPIGVGHYIGENFLHIDHREGEAKIAWEQRRQGGVSRYHPRWATRRSKAPPAVEPVPADSTDGHDGDAAAATAAAASAPAAVTRPARTLRATRPSS